MTAGVGRPLFLTTDRTDHTDREQAHRRSPRTELTRHAAGARRPKAAAGQASRGRITSAQSIWPTWITSRADPLARGGWFP